VLSPTLDTLRTLLHLLGAAVWVGGQIVLAGVVSRLRTEHREALPLVARAFARTAWPAYAVVVLTGMWSLAVIDVAATSTAYQVTLLLKVAVALVSGAAAVVHSVGTSRLAKAAGGAIGSLGAVAAMALGVLSTTGT
jgi:putative copper export protein